MTTDFITKLRQIEEQAHSVKAEMAPGLSSTRLQHIVVLAMTLRGRLEFGAAAVVSASGDLSARSDSFVTDEASIG